ncbi:unnamed protein product [Diatraea saccharalis]|uniref:SET and MYND domain-containing protein 4 n=1 Tax=Diatraea saccharalis TaxID=40085 RepID=A0A9N9R3T2_9NEOP|nr:unnamed protein product [Diatraea saccharalis]
MARIYEELDVDYATKCSDVTLCSNTKGFFKTLAEDMVSIAENNNWLQDFEKTEDAKKIEAVKHNKEIMDALEEVFSRIQPLHRGKDARISYERRIAAQAALKDDDLTKALGLASQAVLRAPMTGEDEVFDGGVSLALALWLRSEVLLKSGRHKAALEDLKLALKERLPAKMRAQYYWRMGHCYKGAGEPTRAKVSYELAGRLLANDEAAKTQLVNDVQALDYTVQSKHPPDKPAVTVTGGSKQNMPALSKLLKITEEENKGRYAVANSDIRTGDVLLIDHPYAACLHTDYYGTHCFHCFRRLEDIEEEAPVGCPKCAAVVFCGVRCRDVAVSTYHPYECQYLDLFIGSGMSILSQIALRIITQAGLDTSLTIYSKYFSNTVKTVEGAVLNDIEGVTKKSKMKSRKERLNRTKKGLKSFTEKNKEADEVEIKVDNKMNYEEKLELKAAQFYSLCAHSEQRKGGDYLKRVVMAMFLTECLKNTGFFEKCEQDNLAKAEVSITEMLVRNLQILQFNAHEIYETLRGEHMFNGSKPIYIAVGIYPTGALFNHECYPAVARYFDGSKIILRATRPLSPGDVVSENYGPHFLMRSLIDRQRSLACRYWFKCECVACKEDWPTLKQMNVSDTPVFLRCPNTECTVKFRPNNPNLPSKCMKCSTPIDKELMKINLDSVNRSVNQYQEGAKLMEAENTEDAIRIMCDAIDMYHEVAWAPHRDTHLAQEALRSCFASSGNVHVIRGEPINEGTERKAKELHCSPTNLKKKD